MTKEQKQIAVIIVGLAFIVVSVGMRLLAKGKSPKGKADQAAVASTDGQNKQDLISFALPDLSEDVVAQQRAGAQRPYRRDPFKLARLPAEEKEVVLHDEFDPLLGLTISAIVLREGIGMAMVNDRLIRPGDTLRGHKVLRITRAGLLLKNNGEEVVLPYDN